MKKLIGFIAAWTLYGIGHVISLTFHIDFMGRLYPIYNTAMIWSSEIQDWAGNKSPWRRK